MFARILQLVKMVGTIRQGMPTQLRRDPKID